MWIFIIAAVFIAFIILKFVNADTDAANSILKCYNTSLAKILDNHVHDSADSKDRIRETLENMGMIIAGIYIYTLPANTYQRKHIRENFEDFISDCRGITDTEVTTLISKIFWYNESNIQSSFDFKNKYTLDQLNAYQEFDRLRHICIKLSLQAP